MYTKTRKNASFKGYRDMNYININSTKSLKKMSAVLNIVTQNIGIKG